MFRKPCQFAIGLLLNFVLVLLSAPVDAYLTHQQAQHLNLKGQQQFQQGDPQTALQTWQQSEKLYRQSNDAIGAAGTQLNQAKALQFLGFYRRAQQSLDQITQSLAGTPDSSLKAQVLLDLGNLLRLQGEFERSQQVLQQSLAIAQRLNAPSDTQAALMQLGSLAFDQNQIPIAQTAFTQAIAIPAPQRVSAQLQLLKLLLKSQQPTEALLSTIGMEHATVYEQIEYAQLRLQADPKAAGAVAQILSRAIAQPDRRAASFAWGYLGKLYVQTQQWQDAKQATQRALALAQAIHVPELVYQWQWQLGQIGVAKADLPAAMLAYRDAIATLKSLRQDLVAVNPDKQFSFREQVEPVYREWVELLLRQDKAGEVSQNHLRQARDAIEALQIAELNNFFREACLDATSLPADQIDAAAAVIYPIVLRDRLDIIVAIPNQPLQHYTTQRSQAEITAAIRAMTQSMRRTSFVQERLAAAQPLYDWLIRPALPTLEQHQIRTLVFVLDGPLRRLPIAALHSRKQFLIEQYQIAITPNLRLFQSRGLALKSPRAVIAALSEGENPLPGVTQEVGNIKHNLNAKILLNREFTTRSLKSTAATQPFEVLHLATHGQFGATPQETYIQTWDGLLTLNDLQVLLQQRGAIELLVLSACETAKGNDRAALGIAGMAVRSGARTTLGTLWQVNDQSTSLLVSEFYRTLIQARQSRAEALRSAQLLLLKQPQYSHPFYWAAFVLVGNWQ